MKEHLKQFFNRSVIVDANVLFDLYEVHGLYILNKIFSEVCIPVEVISELLDDEQFKEIHKNIRYRKVVIEKAEGYNLYARLSREQKELSAADKHLVCNAFEKGLLCVSNDSQVRKACQKYNIKVIRTLGVLGCARTTGVMSQEDLQRMFNLLLSPESSSFLTVSHPDIKRFALDFDLTI